MKALNKYRKSTYGLLGGIAIGVAFSLAVATLFVTGSVMATESKPPKVVSKIDVKYPDRTLTRAEQDAISLSASRILKHVDAARTAILNEDKELAQTNIGKAQKLVRIIDETEPAVEVKTEIQAGRESYTDKDRVKPAWVTLSDEVSLVDLVTPVVSAKADSQGNHQQATPSGQVQASENHGTAAAPEVAFSGIEYSAVQFNLNLARDRLQRASVALKDGQLDEADADLATIQADGVLFSSASADLPLRRASENLSRAHWEFNHGNDKLTKTLLSAASDALKEHVAMMGDKDSKDVKDVQKQIAELSKTLDSTERKVARHMLVQWIDKIENLFES